MYVGCASEAQPSGGSHSRRRRDHDRTVSHGSVIQSHIGASVRCQMLPRARAVFVPAKSAPLSGLSTGSPIGPPRAGGWTGRSDPSTRWPEAQAFRGALPFVSALHEEGPTCVSEGAPFPHRAPGGGSTVPRVVGSAHHGEGAAGGPTDHGASAGRDVRQRCLVVGPAVNGWIGY